MKRVVVVGAGISGLAAAWAAAERAAGVSEGLEVLVLERDPEVGGKAKSHASDGWLVEAGPTAYQGPDPALEKLVDAAGLRQDLLAAEEAAAHRFVVGRGRMREIHAHPLKFALSGLLGLSGMLRILAEPLVPARLGSEDESVWDFARRRIGRQAADNLIAPMVLGVFAGDAHRLSLPAAFPKLAALEREHGSLIRGMLVKRRQRRGPQEQGHAGPMGPAPTLFSFRQGLQSLPRGLARRGRFQVRCGAAVEAVVAAPDGRWRVVISERGETLSADAVVLASEAWASAALVRECAPKLATLLEGIESSPLAVVALGFGTEARRQVPRGFGVLVPRGEGYRILGCLWDSFLFPGRSPDSQLLVRAMVGGSVDPSAADLADGELVALVQNELGRLLRLQGAPIFQRILRWPRAIPQYLLGHLARVAAIEEELSARPGLFLAGNALHGISFGKAAAAGLLCGERAARLLEQPAT